MSEPSTPAPEHWATKDVRDAIRAVLRTNYGISLAEGVVDDDDNVWAEDALIDAVVDRLRAVKAA